MYVDEWFVCVCVRDKQEASGVTEEAVIIGQDAAATEPPVLSPPNPSGTFFNLTQDLTTFHSLQGSSSSLTLLHQKHSFSLIKKNPADSLHQFGEG